MSISLTELRARVRQGSELGNSPVVKDDKYGLDAWINDGIKELWRVVTSEYSMFFATQVVIVVTAGLEDYTLPSDAGRVLEVQWKNRPTRPYGYLPDHTLFNSQVPLYRVEGYRKLRLYPAPQESGEHVRICYLARPPLLVNDADLLDVPEGWEEYVVTFAIIKFLTKTEQNADNYLFRLYGNPSLGDGGLKAQIVDEARRFDINKSPVIRDVGWRGGQNPDYMEGDYSAWGYW